MRAARLCRLPITLCSLVFVAQAWAQLPTLSINDVTLDESTCEGPAFVFTVTLSYLGRAPVTVNYATSDGTPGGVGIAAVGGQDYVPAAGALTFTHDGRPNGPRGSYLQTITVPLGNYVASTGGNDGRTFTVTLSGATNATIGKAQGAGTMLDAALGCTPAQNATCYVNFCGARTACKNVNISACATPGWPVLSQSGGATFAACSQAGLWRDTDGDGMSDAAELQGYIDVNCDGTFDPSIDVNLNVDGPANPKVPDIYLHYDYTTGSDGHSHNPPAQALALVKEAFSLHGVMLHVDPAHNNLCEHPGDPGCVTVGSGAYVATLLKNTDGTYATQAACVGANATTPHALRAALPYLKQIDLAYHYMIFSHFSTCDSIEDCLNCPFDTLEANQCSLSPERPGFGALGSAEIQGDDAIVSLGRFVDAARPIPLETWAGMIMHELGHNLGLLHGGSACTNYDPNYISVMNYWFSQHGITVAASPGSVAPKVCTTDDDCPVPAHCSTGPAGRNTCYRLDYSSLQLPVLNKGALNESIGLNAGPASTDITFYFACGGACSIPAPTNGSPIDWNSDGNATETSVSADINNDGSTTDSLGTQDDWAQSGGLFTHLVFSFQTTPGFGDGPLFALKKRGQRPGSTSRSSTLAATRPDLEQLFQCYRQEALPTQPVWPAAAKTTPRTVQGPPGTPPHQAQEADWLRELRRPKLWP